MKNFNNEPWTEYGKAYKHLMIDIDDVDDSDLLIELPRIVKFIDSGLRKAGKPSTGGDSAEELEKGLDDMSLRTGGVTLKTQDRGAVFVHCAAGKSRSVSAIVAYLLWRYPECFDPSPTTKPSTETTSSSAKPPSLQKARSETATEAVQAALSLIQQTRPMAEPNDGFMQQLELWWEMGCPEDIESHRLYQKWSYNREVEENVAIGQAPTKLRFEDEEAARAATQSDSSSQLPSSGDEGPKRSLRCKRCRKTLATGPFIANHKPRESWKGKAGSYHRANHHGNRSSSGGGDGGVCQHFFIEPLSWMRAELSKSSLSGRLLCPNPRCAAGVGRYDWKGFTCSCGEWITPAFSLQKGRVDEEIVATAAATGARGGATNGQGVGGGPGEGRAAALGIRMPPGSGMRRDENL